MCRKFAVFLRRFPNIRTDVVGLLDEWAARFFEELDYVREGNNGILFAKQMEKDLPQVRKARYAAVPAHLPISCRARPVVSSVVKISVGS